MLTEAWALRTEEPATFHEWDASAFSQLNQTLLQMWNTLNGRVQLDTMMTDPDGNRRGSAGESVLYLPVGGDSQLCFNVDGATDWDCVVLTE